MRFPQKQIAYVEGDSRKLGLLGRVRLREKFIQVVLASKLPLEVTEV